MFGDAEKKKYFCAFCGREFDWDTSGFNAAALHEDAHVANLSYEGLKQVGAIIREGGLPFPQW